MTEQYYMLLATDGEGVHEARMAARPAHLARLEKLKAEGRLLTAGPNPMPERPGTRVRQPDYRRLRLARRRPGVGGARPLCRSGRIRRNPHQTL